MRLFEEAEQAMFSIRVEAFDAHRSEIMEAAKAQGYAKMSAHDDRVWFAKMQ